MNSCVEIETAPDNSITLPSAYFCLNTFGLASAAFDLEVWDAASDEALLSFESDLGDSA